jgi:hypothetical protein
MPSNARWKTVRVKTPIGVVDLFEVFTSETFAPKPSPDPHPKLFLPFTAIRLFTGPAKGANRFEALLTNAGVTVENATPAGDDFVITPEDMPGFDLGIDGGLTSPLLPLPATLSLRWRFRLRELLDGNHYQVGQFVADEFGDPASGPLERIFAGWYHHSAEGSKPALLDERCARLYRGPNDAIEHTHHRRFLSFHPNVDSGGTTTYTVRIESVCREWHRPWGQIPVPLWPLDVAPLGDDLLGALEEGRELGLSRRADLAGVQYIDGGHSPVGAWWEVGAACVLETQKPWVRELVAKGWTPLHAWNRLFAEPYLAALRTVRSDDPSSLVPIFEAGASASQSWRLSYKVDEIAGVTGRRYRAAFKGLTVDGDHGIVVRATFPNFLSHDGQALVRTLHLEPDVSRTHAIAWGVRDGADRTKMDVMARIGALDLTFAAPTDPTSPIDSLHLSRLGHLHAGFSRPVDSRPVDSESPIDDRTPALDVDQSFAIRAFRPGSQDPTVLDRAMGSDARTSSLVVPVTPPGANGPANTVQGTFLLTAVEQTSYATTQSLRLSLQRSDEDQAEPKPVDLIIIDETPLLVAHVHADVDLGATGELASWDSARIEGGGWELVDNGRNFDVLLPPQAVGEELLKAYSDPRVTPDPEQQLGYKFSPPAWLRLGRTPLRKRYSEAPWNLRRLLGYPGQTLPGTRLSSLEFELLYGLSATISTTSLQLVEVEARLGRTPPTFEPSLSIEPQLEQKLQSIVTAAGKAARDYRNDLRRLRSRLARLELWLASQGAAGLSLDEGVSYRFRASRHVTNPIDVESTELIEPSKGEWRFMPARPYGTTTSDKVYGIRGGVDWGFESKNIYEEVRHAPSSSGLIANPWLSALGGGGYQKAGFSSDKSKIYSDSFLGRTFFYSIERIGRIGMLWNRAKHVIVYERTVAASDQFPDDGNWPWEGRAVVRKVREYVELLEPLRSYPDRSAATAEADAAAAFVLESRFPHPRLPVDGKWGEDIPGGWRIPLWVPGANPYYKEPDVFLRLATSGGDSASGWARCTNPEILHFYTSTDPKDTSDTDKWTPKVDVDFPLADVPLVPEDVSPATDTIQPDPDGVELDYDRFTLNLDTGGRTANLLAGRSATATTNAVIENVTLVRRSLKPFSPTLPPGLENLSKARAAARRVPAAVAASVTQVLDDLARELQRGTADLKLRLAKIRDKLLVGADAVLAKLQATVRKEVGDAYGKLAATVDLLVTQQNAAVEGWPTNFEVMLGGAIDRITLECRAFAEKRVDRTMALVGIQEALDGLVGQLHAVDFVHQRALSLAARLRDEATIAQADLAQFVEEAKGRMVRALAAATAAKDLAPYQLALVAVATDMQGRLRVVRERLAAGYPERVTGQMVALLDAVSGLVRGLTLTELPADPAVWKKQLEALAHKLDLSTIAPTIDADVARMRADLKEIHDEIETKTEAVATLRALGPSLIDGGEAKVHDAVRSNLVAASDGVKTVVRVRVKNWIARDKDVLLGVFGDYAKIATGLLDGEIASAVGLAGDLLMLALQTTDPRLLQGIQRAVGGAMSGIGAVAKPYEDLAATVIRRMTPVRPWDLEPDDRFRVLRAFGRAPIAQSMVLNRDRLAYYFQRKVASAITGLLDHVDFTPSTALVNRFGKELEQLDLKSLGIRLPSIGVGETFLSGLDKGAFDFRSILPDFAGINLAGLLEGVAFPSQHSDAVKVTHGIDRTSGRAWAQCDVAVDLDGDSAGATLFQLGPLLVKMTGAHFDAHSRVAVSTQGIAERKVNASIHADWEVWITGECVVALRGTTVRFDEAGRLSFDMGARSVYVHRALQFLTDLLSKALPGGDSGLSMEMVPGSGGLPAGVRGLLALALPPLGTGAFSISNLSLSSFFSLAMRDGFEIEAALSIATRERPFNLSILCVGGGGWFTAGARYRPFSGDLHGFLSVGLSAGATIAFDIGIASGGVSLLVSLGVEWTFGRGGALDIFLRLTLSGEVNVLGIVTVGLLLMLEARYHDGTLYCTGILELHIKIGWFFNISIHQEVHCQLGSGSGSRSLYRLDDALGGVSSLDVIHDAASDYLASFGVDLYA